MIYSRRLFLKFLAHVGLFPSVFFPGVTALARSYEHKDTTIRWGRVVRVRRPDVFVNNAQVSTLVIRQMLRDGITALTGLKNPVEAWLSLFSADDTIAIKVNSLGGKNICTHPEVAYTVAEELVHAGISSSNIIIWDRLTEELKKCGYKIQRGGANLQCFGTDADYESRVEFSGSIGSCFSRILTRYCTALISIPVLKDHDLAGVSLHLKNFYGAIHNPNKYHDNGCDPYIADLHTYPHIKNKMRLIICDALRGQYHGGPAFKPQWSWNYSGLLLSQDPVAIDSVGLEIIEKKRREKDLPTLKGSGRNPKYIQTAAQKRIGIADLNKIEIIDS